MTWTAAGDGAGRAELQEQVIELLRAVARSLRRQHVELAAGKGFPLSGPYLALLHEIVRHPGVTVSELARLTGLPKSRVSVLMTRLVAERIVRKDPDEHDSRLVLLNITPEGRRRAAEWSAASRQAIGQLLQPLRDDELAVIASGLTTQRHDPGGAPLQFSGSFPLDLQLEDLRLLAAFRGRARGPAGHGRQLPAHLGSSRAEDLAGGRGSACSSGRRACA